MTSPNARTAPPFGINDLAAAKRDGRPIVMATGYDFASANALDAAGVDIVPRRRFGGHDGARSSSNARRHA